MPDTTSGAAAPASIMGLVDAYARAFASFGPPDEHIKTEAARRAVLLALGPQVRLPLKSPDLAVNIALIPATGMTNGEPHIGLAGSEHVLEMITAAALPGASIDETYDAVMAAKKENSYEECYSMDGERYTTDSIADVAAAADAEAGATVHIGQGRKRPASYYLPSPDGIIDDMQSSAYGDADEYAEGFPAVTKEGEKALAIALHFWAQEHVPEPTFYTVDGVVERPITEEDLS